MTELATDENCKLRLATGKVQGLIEQQWEHTARTMRPYDQGVMTGLERALALMCSILAGDFEQDFCDGGHQ